MDLKPLILADSLGCVVDDAAMAIIYNIPENPSYVRVSYIITIAKTEEPCIRATVFGLFPWSLQHPRYATRTLKTPGSNLFLNMFLLDGTTTSANALLNSFPIRLQSRLD